MVHLTRRSKWPSPAPHHRAFISPRRLCVLIAVALAVRGPRMFKSRPPRAVAAINRPLFGAAAGLRFERAANCERPSAAERSGCRPRGGGTAATWHVIAQGYTGSVSTKGSAGCFANVQRYRQCAELLVSPTGRGAVRRVIVQNQGTFWLDRAAAVYLLHESRTYIGALSNLTMIGFPARYTENHSEHEDTNMGVLQVATCLLLIGTCHMIITVFPEPNSQTATAGPNGLLLFSQLDCVSLLTWSSSTLPVTHGI